jgi:uncharacterized protein with WD repeat
MQKSGRTNDHTLTDFDDTAELAEQLQRSGKAISEPDALGLLGSNAASAASDPAQQPKEKQHKKKGIPGALAEQKARLHARDVAAKQEAAETLEREKRNKAQVAGKKDRTAKLTKRNRRGQPILTHHIDHILTKLGHKK